MKDENKTKKQLITELAELRHRNSMLEAQATDRKLQENILRKSLKDLEIRIEKQTAKYIKANEELQAEISERKRAEKALYQGEERFRILFENSPDAITLIDPFDSSVSWPIVDCNEAFCRMNGYTRDELIGQSIDILHEKPEDPAVRAAYLERLKREGTIRLEATHHRKNGTYAIFQVVTCLVTIDGCELVLGIDRDITQHKHDQEALANERFLFSTLMDNISDNIYFKDADNRFVRINHSLAAWFGLSDPSQAIGKTDFDFFAEDHARPAYEDEKEIMLTGHPLKNIEEKEVWPDGRVTWVSTTKMPLIDEKGKIVGTFGISRDITERKQAEQERERLNAELKEKNRELEQIVYVTSHDLRSPLVNIQGFSKELEMASGELQSILQREQLPSEIKKELAPIMEEDIPEALSFIHTSTIKMDILLSGLLRLSRFGRAAITIKKLDMNKLVSDVIKNFEFQIKEDGITVQKGQLPSIYGDDMQIHQLFSNLLNNALKYLDPKRPGVIKFSGVKENGRVVYCAEDNGVGIAPRHQEKIYELFYRLDPYSTPGEGLGLTIARKILGRHNGKIWVESEVGKGSKFFLS
jgi:PAS domain S-box-containing protein